MGRWKSKRITMIDKIKKFFVESKTKLLISWPNNHIGLILIAILVAVILF